MRRTANEQTDRPEVNRSIITETLKLQVDQKNIANGSKISDRTAALN